MILLGTTLTVSEMNYLTDYIFDNPNSTIYTPDEDLYNFILDNFTDINVEFIYYRNDLVLWDGTPVPENEIILLTSTNNLKYKFKPALPILLQRYKQGSLEDYEEY